MWRNFIGNGGFARQVCVVTYQISTSSTVEKNEFFFFMILVKAYSSQFLVSYNGSSSWPVVDQTILIFKDSKVETF